MPCDGAIHLRHAVTSDARAVAQVHVDSWREAYRGQLPESYLNGLSVSDRASSWERALSGAHGTDRPFWVAEVNAEVVGFIHSGPSRDDDATPRTGEVYAIYVHPGCWERGIGTLLLQRAVRDLRAHGYDDATLWCLSTNQQARGFYEKAKWLLDPATRRDNIGGQDVEEVRYRISLAP